MVHAQDRFALRTPERLSTYIACSGAFTIVLGSHVLINDQQPDQLNGWMAWWRNFSFTGNQVMLNALVISSAKNKDFIFLKILG
jgi:hypothetical protein